MLTNSIKFKNFNQPNRFEKKLKQILQNLLSNQDEIIKSLGKTYSNNYNILARGQSISNDDYKKEELKNIELDSGECCIFHGNIDI